MTLVAENLFEPVHEISNSVVCVTSKASDQTARILCWLLEYSMIVKLLTEHHSEFLSLKGGCTGSYESTHVKMPHCWKSHAKAQFIVYVSGRRGGPQGGPMGPPGSDGWNMVGGQSRTPFKSIDRSIDPTKMKISKVTYDKRLKTVRKYKFENKWFSMDLNLCLLHSSCI